VVGCCEHSIEQSVSIKGVKCLDSLNILYSKQLVSYLLKHSSLTRISAYCSCFFPLVLCDFKALHYHICYFTTSCCVEYGEVPGNTSGFLLLTAGVDITVLIVFKCVHVHQIITNPCKLLQISGTPYSSRKF
jgi:hypothetical protein